MKLLLSTVTIYILASGCASYHYSQIIEGELHGKLLVQWYHSDEFIFIPDIENPLTFTRHTGESITPGKMYTDGGSIPRPLWAIKRYSPWGYAPAFIIHDWLFLMQHCKFIGYENYDANKAAWIMSEVTKTLMEDPDYGGRSEFVLYSMYEAVRSPIAKYWWENGKCIIPEKLEKLEAESAKPMLEYIIEFPY
jgi:hypothetical protein